MFSVFKDKQFIKKLWILALPITIQSFITSSLNLIDNLMVGRLGEEAIATVGLANQYIFIFNLCITGVNAGASVFMAQFWGKKDLPNIKKILGLDIVVGLAVALLFGFGAIVTPEAIMSILSKDQNVIALGTSYLLVVGISCLFSSFTQAYSSALRSTEQVKVPMYASLIGVGTNAFLNWILIFGMFGMPSLGVVGAAIATTIARLIEMIYIVSYVYISKNKIAGKLKDLLSFDKHLVKIYFKTSWPVIVNEIVWSVGITAYSVAYAQIGTNAVATMQIATTLNNVFTVLLVGMAIATSIMVGNYIGAGQEDEARSCAKNIGILTPIMSIVVGAVIFITAPIVLKLFNVTPETYSDTIDILRIMALFLPIRTFNMVMIVGVFRGGGDTTYSMLVQAGTVWLYSVPLAFIGAVAWQLPIQLVYILICSEECIKIWFELRRLKNGKWIKNIIHDTTLS